MAFKMSKVRAEGNSAQRFGYELEPTEKTNSKYNCWHGSYL